MSDRTLLYLTDDAGLHLQLWQQFGESEPRQIVAGGWADASVIEAFTALAERGVRPWVVMPGTWGGLLRVPIPSKRREQALQAITFAVEDRVPDDVAQLHLTLGPRPLPVDADSGDVIRWPVLVMPADRRQRLLDRLAEVDVQPESLVHPLDVYALPETGCWAVHVLPAGADLLVKTGLHAGFVLPNAALPGRAEQALGAVLEGMAESERPEALVLHGLDAFEAPEEMNRFGIAISRQPEPVSPAGWFANLAHGQSLSAVTSVRTRQSQQRRRQWAWMAALVVVLGTLLVVQRGVSGWKAMSQTAQLRAQVAKDFHAALPNVSRMVNPRVQLQQALDKRSRAHASANFLALLAPLSKAFEAARAHDDKLVLDQLVYRDDRLVVSLTGAQYDVLQQVYQQLQQHHELQTRRIDSGVSGDQAHMRLALIEGAGNGAGRH